MRYYIVDAFTDRLFHGNPAGVCMLDEWPDDSLMQSIAAENNLAETAFIAKREDHYDLRWFSPEVEIDLCGHATLAGAFVISTFADPGAEMMEFRTMSGILSVARQDDLFVLDFPARPPKQIDIIQEMEKAIGTPVTGAYLSRDMMLVVSSEQEVRSLAPDMSLVSKLPGCFGLIVTAKGSGADFVSRFFAPGAGIQEDPVTGSAHSTLIPFWSEVLKKDKMVAMQLSKRGGTLICENCGDRVKIAGRAALYLQGEIFVG